MDHCCYVEIETRKIDSSSGYSFHKCEGNNPMLLQIAYEGKDGTECYYDSWIEIEVNFCPFCGKKSGYEGK